MSYVGMDVQKKTTTDYATNKDWKIAKRGKVANGDAGWLDIGTLLASGL